MSVGIEKLKAVVDLVLAGVEAGVKVSADGKVDVQDLPAVVGVLPLIPPAVSAASGVPSELGDLDPQEAAELVTHVMSKLAITDEKAKKVIAAALKVGVASVELVAALKS